MYYFNRNVFSPFISVNITIGVTQSNYHSEILYLRQEDYSRDLNGSKLISIELIKTAIPSLC